jgi:carbon starvation protein
VFDMVRVCTRFLLGKPVPALTEVPHIPSRLVEEWVRD